MTESDRHLDIYLNDHLAGAAAALEILGDLRKAPGFQDWADEITSDVEADRQELMRLMHNAGIEPSGMRQAAARMTGKAATLKMLLDDRSDGALRLLELLEALAIGIDGKRALWAALRAVSSDAAALEAADYDRLIERAEDQRARVEARRLGAAAEALGASLKSLS